MKTKHYYFLLSGYLLPVLFLLETILMSVWSSHAMAQTAVTNIRPWVQYADRTLTFRYGEKESLGENEYPLNDKSDASPRWAEHKNEIEKVVFDASFANALPVTCRNWFKGCVNLKSIDGLEHLNTKNVTDMSSMFSGCGDLTSLDLSSFDVGGVTDMENMFASCTTLVSVYVSDKFVTSQSANGTGMFSFCYSIKGAVAFDDDNENKIGKDMANYTTGYLKKLVANLGGENIGVAGQPLKADPMVLADDKDLVVYEDFTTGGVSYSRSGIAGKWASLCLPFDVELGDKNFRAFTLLSANGDAVVLQEVNNVVPAGVPVIIGMKEGADNLYITASDTEIKSMAEGSATNDGNYKLVGLYAKKMFDKNSNCYIVKGDKLMSTAKLLTGTSTQTVGSLPFRAYIIANGNPTGQAGMLSIGIDGDATVVDMLNASDDDHAEYYDMQGHRLNEPQKGVNILKRGNKTMKVIIR